MVQNAAAMQRKFRNAPPIIHDRLARGLERIGDDLVQQMRLLNPLPEDIVINWTWGDAPRGAITIGKVKGGKTYEKMSITLYAVARQGSGFSAAWFEHGTNPRTQKTTGRYTGFIAAQPFLWPTYRANQNNIKSRLSGILRRAIKKANSL